MTAPSRRSRASLDSMVMQIHRLIGGLALQDTLISKAILATDGDMAAAARLMQIRSDSFRQRHTSLLTRVARALPSLSFRRGKVAREISADQFDGMGEAIGL